MFYLLIKLKRTKQWSDRTTQKWMPSFLAPHWPARPLAWSTSLPLAGPANIALLSLQPASLPSDFARRWSTRIETLQQFRKLISVKLSSNFLLPSGELNLCLRRSSMQRLLSHLTKFVFRKISFPTTLKYIYTIQGTIVVPWHTSAPITSFS
jgi:hypothetical protein